MVLLVLFVGRLWGVDSCHAFFDPWHIAYKWQDPWHTRMQVKCARNFVSWYIFLQSMKKVFREVHFYAAAFFSTDKMLFVYTFENVFFRYYKHSYNHPLEFHSCILHAYTSGAYATGLGHQGPTCKAAVTLGGGGTERLTSHCSDFGLGYVIMFLWFGQIC